MKKLLALFLIIFLSTMTSGCLDMIFGPVEDEDPLKDQGDEKDISQDPDTQLTDENSWEIVFYCIDKSTDLLVPVTVLYPKQEGIAKASVEELVLGSELSRKIASYGLEMPLPQMTEVLGISIHDGTARVDLSQDILTFKNYRHESLGVTALVYTLTQFQTIERVQLAINGEIAKTLFYDTYVKVPLDRTMGVNTSVIDGVNLKENTKVLNYYPVIRENKTYFIPETKVINKVENVLEATVVRFLEGPNSDLLVNNIPVKVSLLEVKLEENTAVVNLSKEFLEFKVGTERAVIDSLVLTLLEIDEVDAVKILVEGVEIGESLTTPKFPKIP